MARLLFAALLPFLTALLLPLLASGSGAGWIASAVVVAVFALIASVAPGFFHHGEAMSTAWIEGLGFNFSVQADGLSMLFALLISGVGVVVFTYAAAYLGEREHRVRFFCYLSLFMGAMLGVVLSSNLMTLFVFWELTSISSFLLIGFWHKRERSRDGALKALVVTGSGGLALLVGFVMIGSICGSFEIPRIIEQREVLAASPWAAAATVLVILGAITKSAQIPFHLWLPSAMEAPTPVSAFLHAATMVKAGLYLVARLGPALSEIALWTPTLTVLGLATMTWCSVLALRQTDLKALLAFSTVSQLGLILTLLAPAEPAATGAGLFHLLNHGLFKGALFLLVGIIEHEAHTRDLTELGPLARTMPRTWFLLAVAALAMAGVPPLGGFVSKELFLEHVLHLDPILAVVAVVGAVATAAYCFALAAGLYRGRGEPSESAAKAHDPGLNLLWGPATLVVCAVALGPLAAPLAGNAVESAATALTPGHAEHVHLHLGLWHGFTPALAASAVAILGGAALFAFGWLPRVPDRPVLLADRAYQTLLDGLQNGARNLTRAYMSGLLYRYLAAILAVLTTAVAVNLVLSHAYSEAVWPARSARPFEWVVVGAAVAAAIGTCVADTRLAAILALGANGYLLALLFGLLNAPDLALTQVMVETISVAMYLAVFVFLPSFRARTERPFRPLHAMIAGSFGVTIASLLYAARGSRVSETISTYFVENSVGLAGGHNIVNVILVDFRGLDTLGEITVLGVAALACYAIIKLRPEERG